MAMALVTRFSSIPRLMGKDNKCPSIQLINGNGEFNNEGIENFAKKVEMNKWGISYVVVSIMGPQSSGKSTILNHVFHTNFCEMDDSKGSRSQTTKGIWVAMCDDIEPRTLVLDVEGTDGNERGEDDTTFEKQSTLFALHVSDILLINMWYNDIGREQAANRPLLRNVFEVGMRMFSDDFGSRKRTLMFVIRDTKMQLPLEKLEYQVRNNIQMIWDSVPKPEEDKETPLSKFFNVEVEFFPHFEYEKPEFKGKVASLRERFSHSIESGGLAGDRRGVLPAGGFSSSAKMIWQTIKENKDLDLPNHRVMVAAVRCDEVAYLKFNGFAENKDWRKVKTDVKSRPIQGFGKKLDSLFNTYISEYDKETLHFDENVRSAKREVLKVKLLQLVQASYLFMLGHIRSGSLDKFKQKFAKDLTEGKGFSTAARDCIQSSMKLFDEECKGAVIKLANWDTSEEKKKLQIDMDAHVASECGAKLSELTRQHEAKFSKKISEPFIKALLDRAGNDTWREIRNLLRRESESAVSSLSAELCAFHLEEQHRIKILESLAEYARCAVEAKAKEEAGRVLIHMKKRFEISIRGSDSGPRDWTGMEDIEAITRDARISCLKLLSVMAAIRLDGEVDNIEKTLSLALLESTNNAVDPLASSTWENVLPSKTLITPIKCKSLWSKFMAETEYTVKGADVDRRKAATVHCEKIVKAKLSCFDSNKDWIRVKSDAESGLIPSIRKRVDLLIFSNLSEYDKEAGNTVEDIKSAKREELKEKLLKLVRPAYQSLLDRILSTVLNEFKEQFEEAFNRSGDIIVATSESTQSSLLQFNHACEVAGFEIAHSDVLEKTRHKLKEDLFSNIIRVIAKNREKFTAKYDNVPDAENIKYNDALAANSKYYDVNDEQNDAPAENKKKKSSFWKLLRDVVVVVAAIFGMAPN